MISLLLRTIGNASDVTSRVSSTGGIPGTQYLIPARIYPMLPEFVLCPLNSTLNS